MVEARHSAKQQPNTVSWKLLILGYADNGQGHTALDLLKRMRNLGLAPDSVTFVAALKACSCCVITERKKRGEGLHNLLIDNRSDSDTSVQSALIDMYARCNSMVEARRVFDSMKHPDVVCWNVLILGYASNGQSHTALEHFFRMITGGPTPSSVTFLAALKACACLAVKGRAADRQRCKHIQDLALENDCFDADFKVQSSLVNVYCKCGSMVDARQVFDNMKHRNVVAWNVLILGYAENGQGFTALDMFERMQREGLAPNRVTILSALKACTAIALIQGASSWPKCRDWGKRILDVAITNGCDSDRFVQNTLIDLYAKCGSMVDARQVFDCWNHRDVVSWNTLILGYADTGQGLLALKMFTRMKREGPAPNSRTFLAVLKACGLVGGLDFGRAVHVQMETDGGGLDVILVTCLVDFYAKCGSVLEAQRVFDLHAEARNAITWTALLGGFSSCGDHESVFRLFQAMQDAGFLPTSVTFLCVLTCCGHAGLVDKGKECFDAMLAKDGTLPSVEHYSCMAGIFGRANMLDDAMALLQRMPCSPDCVTWKTILFACHKMRNAGLAKLAFQSLSRKDSSVFMLMGQIYGSRGLLQEQGMVRTEAWIKREETCWTNEAGDVHAFHVYPQHKVSAG